MTIVIVAVALLTLVGLPAVRAFLRSFENESGVRTAVSAALASARAVALKDQRYVGIRFQNAGDPMDSLDAPQYMIFIVHDFDRTGLADGFRAIEGLKPMKLPDSVGVMDLGLMREKLDPDSGSESTGGLDELVSLTTFSIIFSPSGKMVVHDVRVRNRDGVFDPEDPSESNDDIFNSEQNVVAHGVGMFVQDDYPALGLEKEASRRGLVIYERHKFRRAYRTGVVWSAYVRGLLSQAIYVSPYTGTIISKD